MANTIENDPPEQWHEFHANSEITRDGLKKSLENSVVGMIESAIDCFACNTLGHTANHNPKLDFEFHRTKFRCCINQIEELGEAS